MTLSFLHRAAAATPAMAAASLALAGVLLLPNVAVTVENDWWFEDPSFTTSVKTVLSNVPTGYDVTNGQYGGWCIEDNGADDADGPMFLFDTTDPASLPASFQGKPWGKINYLLNHKGTAGVRDVQAAIWELLGTHWNGMYGLSPAAQLLIQAADQNPNFVPAASQVVAVVVFKDGIDQYDPNNLFQDTIIEVTVVQRGAEGCTPGYWKNHLCSWRPTGLSPLQNFDTVFGTDYFTPDITLMQALRLGGGHLNRVARHGTAALLNALHPEVDYPYTPAEVIDFVRAGNADPLEAANELGCEFNSNCNARPQHERLSLFLEFLRRGRCWR